MPVMKMKQHVGVRMSWQDSYRIGIDKDIVNPVTCSIIHRDINYET